jgi:two-component system sensor histidine kinase PilS (NtrC family)
VIAETQSPGGKQAQRLLRLYHLYRLSVGIILVLLISSDMDNQLLTSGNDALLRGGSWLYLILNILLVVFFEDTRRPAQLFSLALADVLLLCGLFYAAGGVASAVGNLLIVSVAIGNTLLRRRIGLLIAAVGALGIVGLSFLLSFSHPSSPNDYCKQEPLAPCVLPQRCWCKA